jgi:FkbM family methyltransferase
MQQQGAVKRIINTFLERFGLRIVKSSTIKTYEEISLDYHQTARSGADLKFFQNMPEDLVFRLMDFVRDSQSQIRQDLFVLAATNFKRNGFFVEFGATDGVSLNNTFMLEKRFGWDGILAEPAKMWHKQLSENRRVRIARKCVWSVTGENVDFIESAVPELSTVREYLGHDSHASSREVAKSYRVETISLNDLLIQFDAPKEIDYLSVDTEGSEYKILAEFDFSKWKVNVLTVEHNFTEDRQRIYELLTSKGFIRVCEEISNFDDWFLQRDIALEAGFIRA